MKQERQAEALVLPSERREKKCERGAFIPYEYKIKIINRNIKILNGSATVTVHICTVTVAIVHRCTIIHKLVWVFFSLKLCKSSHFFHFAQLCPSWCNCSKGRSLVFEAIRLSSIPLRS